MGKKKNKREFLWIFVVLCMGVLIGYGIFFAPNFQGESFSLQIKESSTTQQIADMLSRTGHLKNRHTFLLAARCLLPDKVKAGKYRVETNANNFSILFKIRKGQHFPVKFTFNNIRTRQNLLDKIGQHFLFSPEDLQKLLEDMHFLQQYHLTKENALVIFIPDTYEFYYDINAETFFDKMYRHYQRFWNEERCRLSRELGLSEVEVVTLASIVEEENFTGKEKCRIAGLYINRLRKNMKLQADPTVKFAAGVFSIKRVLSQHLTIDSPYNTYMYAGLPPGPIRMPETATIDSVLHYEHHDYLFMCADFAHPGTHIFTRNADEHLQHARKYHVTLDKKGIK
ncbi:MAG: endolytic transglycosylase MltG [Bacteroidales bacterium]|jgi:UPF0755 protein|nr:endolytic transglycosylase MltG [Bacteroidales bacterium]